MTPKSPQRGIARGFEYRRRTRMAAAAALLAAGALLPALACAAPSPDGAVALVAAPTEPGPLRIHDVQGNTRVTRYDDQLVEGLPGVVTAVRGFGSARGFWFQDSQDDGDEGTSEAIFVFTRISTPGVAVGDDVLVTGTADEFYPTSGDDTPVTTSNQSSTQLTGAMWTVRSSGNPLPAAQRLTPTSVPEQYPPRSAGGGSIDPNVLAPGEFALDFYESREGMLLQLHDVRVVGPSTEFNELWVTSTPTQSPTPRGGTVYGSYSGQNSGRLKIESLIPFEQRPFPQADVGDVLTGATIGVLDYDSFGGYTLQATTLGAGTDGGLAPETTRTPGRTELAIATYNVENLSAADSQSTVDRLARAVVTNLATPDIVALEEIQDDNGPTNDAVVAADQTLQRFVDAIVAAGGPRYDWRQIDPVDDADGGQPGGNIRVAFLFNPMRASFVDRPGGDATTQVDVRAERGRAALSVSPGRIDPENAAWEDSRKPLVGEFTFGQRGQDQTVFVVANHFRSKGGDQPLHGRFQPPQRPSEIQRGAQADAVRGFVDRLYAVDRRANVVVLGDLNDFQFSATLDTLTADGALRNPLKELPAGERYTFLFDGNSQVLDHILLGCNIRSIDYDVVHINAEFADQASDHDPQVARIQLSSSCSEGCGSSG